MSQQPDASSKDHALGTYHPQLMRKTADENSPVLGRVWVLVDFLSNQLADASPFGEPFARASSNWVPSELYLSRRTIVNRIPFWNDARLHSQADGMLQRQLALIQVFLTARYVISLRFETNSGLNEHMRWQLQLN